MRLVYLHQHFRTPAMSGGTQSYEFARRLVDRGHDVHVVTGDMITGDLATPAPGGQPDWRTTVESGVTVHWASVPYRNAMSYRDRMRAFGRFAWLAARRAAGIDHDLVFASSTPLTIAIPAMYAGWRRRAPMVLEVRDLWPEVPIALGALRSPAARTAARTLERQAYRRAHTVIALSPDAADDIQRRFPDVPVAIVPNGCDVGLFADAEPAGRAIRRATGWLGDRPLVLYAGTIGLVNGVDYLVRVAAALRDTHPDIRFAIVGEGREEPRVRALARRLGVLDRTLFMLPPVPKTEAAAMFAACDIAVSTVIDNPVLNANSANKVFDAFAAGRPAAVNHGGWLADVLRDSGAGLVLPATDATRAAQELTRFLTDAPRVAAARAAARRLRARFDRDTLFTDLEDVLMSAARTATERT